MSLSITEADAVATLLRYLLPQPLTSPPPPPRPDPVTEAMPDEATRNESVRAAAGLLADKAHETLFVGPTGEEVAALWDAAPPLVVRAPVFAVMFAPADVRAWFEAQERDEWCDSATVAGLTDAQLSTAAQRLLGGESDLDTAASTAMTDLVTLAVEEKARDQDEFWSLMARATTPEQLHTVLRGLDDDRLTAFEVQYTREHARLHNWGVWAAASVIAGGCGDDGFGDFRAYLLTLGPVVCRQTLADPDHLADRQLQVDPGVWESWSAAHTLAVTRDRTGRHDTALDHRLDRPDPTGQCWTNPDLPKLMPRLWARYQA